MRVSPGRLLATIVRFNARFHANTVFHCSAWLMCILLVSVKSGLAIPADKAPVERPLNMLWVERGLRQEIVSAIAQHSNASLSFGAGGQDVRALGGRSSPDI